jgi:hypothetical protein
LGPQLPEVLCATTLLNVVAIVTLNAFGARWARLRSDTMRPAVPALKEWPDEKPGLFVKRVHELAELSEQALMPNQSLRRQHIQNAGEDVVLVCNLIFVSDVR